jgi:hypothetical protein
VLGLSRPGSNGTGGGAWPFGPKGALRLEVDSFSDLTPSCTAVRLGQKCIGANRNDFSRNVCSLIARSVYLPKMGKA